MGRGGGGWDFSESHLCSASLSFSPHALGWDGIGAAPSPPPIPGQGPKQPTCLPHRLEAREPYIPGRTEAMEAERRGWGGGSTQQRRGDRDGNPTPALTTPCEAGTASRGPDPHRPRLGTEPL